jgi:hypothetical protein
MKSFIVHTDVHCARYTLKIHTALNFNPGTGFKDIKTGNDMESK